MRGFSLRQRAGIAALIGIARQQQAAPQTGDGQQEGAGRPRTIQEITWDATLPPGLHAVLFDDGRRYINPARAAAVAAFLRARRTR